MFSGKNAAQDCAQPAEQNRVLYNGNLYEARMYLTPDQETGVAFDGSIFHIYLRSEQDSPADLVTQWLKDKAGEVLRAKTRQWADKMGGIQQHCY